MKDFINMGLISIESVLILDSEGNRLMSKYYTTRSKTDLEIKKEERTLFEKTRKSSSEIILFNSQMVVYRPVVDIFIYICASLDENEIMIANALNAFIESLQLLLKNQMEKKSLNDNLDLVFLTLDEIIDQGYCNLIRVILETDTSVITQRVGKNNDANAPLADQTLSQVWKTAQEQARSWMG